MHIAKPDGSGDTIFYTGETIEFNGWNPESDHFVFTQYGGGPLHGTHIGRVGGGYDTLSTDPSKIFDLRWVDETRYVYTWLLGDGSFELHLNAWMNPIKLIDTIESIPSFDFAE